MKNVFRNSLFIIAQLVLICSVQAQDASSMLQQLFNKYGSVPNYKVDVLYETVNQNMGFEHTQEGTLVVEGDKYILKFGPNETWLSDGKTEYIGTKETDHSQIMYFCPGENSEAIVEFGSLLTFYATGHTGKIQGNLIQLIPDSPKPYNELQIELDGGEIKAIKAFDDFGTVHKYTISNFSTNTSGTRYVINPREYAEKIDERKGCN